MKKDKIQTVKRLSKKNELKEKQTAATLSVFKDALWPHQQHKSTHFWDTPKKSSDKFQKLGSESKKKMVEGVNTHCLQRLGDKGSSSSMVKE